MPNIDIAKRRRIMKRSMKIGHCICDPKRPCPCDVFTNMGLCPCAGERPDPVDMATVKLTDLVHNAGCASKISAVDLERFLTRLPPVNDPAIISGLPSGDDAGIYKISDEVTLVQTIDVFTPCVDDPYEFGKICAANCLSDIYAMGGIPRTALSVLAFPSETQDGQIMYVMLKGAMEVLAEAQCSLLGGHSIKDEEIKLGFAITGTIDPKKAVELETATVGDLLVLTKPLGIGVLNFARQIGKANSKGLADAEKSMALLNKSAAEAMNEVGVSACTDVTGFGLFGHLIRMARHSGVTARIYADTLPAFEGALDAFGQEIIPGAIERNSEFVGDDLLVEDGVADAFKYLGFDAQTSGGLLIAVPQERHLQLIEAMTRRGLTPSTIGSIASKSEGLIELVASIDSDADFKERVKEITNAALQYHKTLQKPSAPISQLSETVKPLTPENDVCCADVFGSVANESGLIDQKMGVGAGTTAADSMRAFGNLMASTGSDGRINARAKELINFALVVHSRCEPCMAIHLEKAKKMGISQDELDEAAWCAISMGGAPVKMFYSDYLKRNGLS